MSGHAHSTAVVACTSLDGTPVAVTGDLDGMVCVWDLRDGRQIGAPRTGHTDTVNAVACTNVDRTAIAVTGGADNTVLVWNLRSLEAVQTLVAPLCRVVAFASDRSVVVGLGRRSASPCHGLRRPLTAAGSRLRHSTV
ncbi:hypothetical protein [Streptomyces sp. NPDC102487]|uniref:hypothetical protein n=1 Tax=Streptomyces sp. NPDC102487 TaxID=3366182 RepID=UPI00382ABD96